jgi:16S rRNA (adenine1518-N6/adenine1519-N6)-dimethyltransferase
VKQASLYPKARKRFGQNFLQDQAIIDDIVSAISPDSDQHLVEIGPGRGALTEPLQQQAGKLDVVELDRDLVPWLRAQFALASNIKIHEADALQFDYHQLQDGEKKLRVIGNLPYNITTPLLFHLLEQSDCIEDMCFMLQKEVVERICAQPGTKQYGKLSIMMQYQCEAAMLFIVPPEAFLPVPKVDSAIVYLRPRRLFPEDYVDLKALGQLVSQAFSQRRKTIANTLKSLVSSEQLEQAGISVSQRPETISLEQYVELCKIWQQ